jgi:circadian clock protein KaiC
MDQLKFDKTIGTGIQGLDQILNGGLPSHRIYLVEGSPGTGKTTLALQFLREGARLGEKTLYVTLSETRDEIHGVARSHGWTLDGLDLYELEAMKDLLQPEEQYTVFYPAEVEMGNTIKRIRENVEAVQPTRAVFDSLSEMRLLAQSPLRYRRQILALKQFFKGRNCTVLFLDDGSDGKDDLQLHSIAHGVILLEQHAGEYGTTRRRVQIRKMRGVHYRDGYHDVTIRPGGLNVYPRIEISEGPPENGRASLASGIPELDQLTGGGLDFAASTLILGPAGCGKSMLASQYTCAALRRGERAVCYLFEEGIETFLRRCEGIGIDLRRYYEAGQLMIQRIDPAELSAGEFSALVREAVEVQKVLIVVIDSVNGYLNAVPSDRFLLVRMHGLLTYLGQKGVLTILVFAQHGLLQTPASSQVDLSYLADTVILLRYFEAAGSVRQAVSIVKKRVGPHERTIREWVVGKGGLRVGEPLLDFQGVLTGTPEYIGAAEDLFEVERNAHDGAQ